MKDPSWWLNNTKEHKLVARKVAPILFLKKKDSWKPGKVLPAVPAHSYGTFSDATSGPGYNVIRQGMILKNPRISIRRFMKKRANTLVNAKPKKKSRGMVLNTKSRMMNILEISSPHHAGQGQTRMPGIEVPSFRDVPLDRQIKHMNPLGGRDSKGFLVSRL